MSATALTAALGNGFYITVNDQLWRTVRFFRGLNVHDKFHLLDRNSTDMELAISIDLLKIL